MKNSNAFNEGPAYLPHGLLPPEGRRGQAPHEVVLCAEDGVQGERARRMRGQVEDVLLPRDFPVVRVRAADVVRTAGAVKPGSHDVASAVFLTHVLGGAHFVDARYCAVPLNALLEIELVEEPCRSKLTGSAALGAEGGYPQPLP